MKRLTTLLFLTTALLLLADSSYGQKRRVRHRQSDPDSIKIIYTNDSCKGKQKEIHYKNGVGIVTEEAEYYPNCTLKQCQTYYNNGKKKLFWSYDSNGSSGYLLWYWENGNKREERTSSNGTGNAKYYSKKGELKKEESYTYPASGAKTTPTQYNK